MTKRRGKDKKQVPKDDDVYITPENHTKMLNETLERYSLIRALLAQGFFPGKSAAAVSESHGFIGAVIGRIEDELKEKNSNVKKENTEEEASA